MNGLTGKESTMPLRLGKKPPKHDKRTLKLANYLNLAQLPPLPNSAAWSPAVLANGGYPMFKNNVWGCCAIAGPAHLIQTWTANAGSIVTPTDADVLRAYSDVAGFDPELTDAYGNNPTDTGCNLLDVLNYWRKVGIAGHKIGGYVKINHCSVTEMQYAVALFGGALIGVALPDSVVDGDLIAARWDDGVHDAPNPNNGHCVVFSGYDAGWEAETWGAVKDMGYGFGARFIDESFAVFSPEWLNAGGKCPAGLDAVALLADLEAITRA